MHRLAHTLGAGTLVAFVAACSGNAAGSAPAASSAAAPATSLTAPATSAPTTSVPAPVTSSAASQGAPTDAADPAIQPDHIGPLRIGMSLKAAKATGLIVVNSGQDDSVFDNCVSAHWKGQSDEEWMVFNGKYGLRALDSFGRQETPEGIRAGSPLSAVRRAYPQLTWRIDGDEIPDAKRTGGDALVDTVKGDGAHYRISIEKSKVVDVQLESDRTGCYE
ncbi:hypothetical protein AB0J83_45430 [Actinoplanes sp. NPDC049596]|uniref:hypothetical protein n=1 Tax=unclassified Actinoplanes TaxID=2626549 RepID=UPI00342FBAEF